MKKAIYSLLMLMVSVTSAVADGNNDGMYIWEPNNGKQIAAYNLSDYPLVTHETADGKLNIVIRVDGEAVKTIPFADGLKITFGPAVARATGDVDGDGQITMSDANMVVNHYLGNATLSDVKAADVDGDGKITMSDANAIVNMYLSN